MNMLPNSTDVLIVGAGPAGLTLAIALQRAGVDYVLIDKLGEAQNTSRAAVIHAHTLEMLDELGVSQKLIEAGLRLAKFSFRDRDRALLRLRFDRLPTVHSYLLMLPQDATEKILAQHLQELGGAIHRNTAAEKAAQDDAGARVTVTSNGQPQTLTARYVIGADGAHSVIRESMGIAFSGGRHEESFILADVEMDWPLGRGEVDLFYALTGFVVVAPLPNNTFRVVAMMDDAPEHPSLADVQKIVSERGPAKTKANITKVVWSSRFRIYHRMAQTYRRGRFVLVGDAAHVHSPAAGQGMNTGIVDACILGKLLPEVIAGRQPDTVLDLYEELRRPAEDQVQRLAARLTQLATLKSPLKRFLRNVALRVLSLLPSARRQFEMSLSGLSRRQSAELPADILPALAKSMRSPHSPSTRTSNQPSIKQNKEAIYERSLHNAS